MRLWMFLIAVGMIAWFAPVIPFRKNKYFLFFLINSLVDPVYTILRFSFELQTHNYLPFVLLIESATLPANDSKTRIISSISLFMIILTLGNDYNLELIVCQSVLALMVYNLLKDAFLEIKNESAFRVFHILLLSYFLRNAAMFYFYYSDQVFLTLHYTFFLIPIIIIPILITYFGPGKKITVNKKFYEFLQTLLGISSSKINYNEETQSVANIVFVESHVNKKIICKRDGNNLTERESEVISLIGEGLTSKEIAEQLKISKRTVDNHRYIIKQKLGLSKRSEITQYIRNHTESPNKK